MVHDAFHIDRGYEDIVGKHLHFDVARVDNRLLDIDFVVPEGSLRFALRAFQG